MNTLIIYVSLFVIKSVFFLIGYEPPSRFSVTHHLKHLHKFHVKKLIDDLALIDDISITLDLWSNKQMRSFLVITGHFFLQKIVLIYSLRF